MNALTDEDRARMPSLVAYCHNCGNIMAAVVQTDEWDAWLVVAGWVKYRQKIMTLPVSEVRTAKWCDCKIKEPEGQ